MNKALRQQQLFWLAADERLLPDVERTLLEAIDRCGGLTTLVAGRIVQTFRGYTNAAFMPREWLLSAGNEVLRRLLARGLVELGRKGRWTRSRASLDLTGPSRSEGPTFAPRTLQSCSHRGNTPARSDNSGSERASDAASLGGEIHRGASLGVEGYEWRRTALPSLGDPFGSRARLRDALHGDDGSPGNGRVGAS